MGNLAYLVDTDNAIKAATITASTIDNNYPVANLKVLPISKPFRFTGKTSENLQIDLGSAQAIDCIALLNTNMVGGATITVNAGNSANPNGTTYTTTITFRQYDSFKLLPAAQTYRYWKIILANSACPDSFLQIGYLMMGDSTTLGFNYAPDWTFTDEHSNLEHETELGTWHVIELYNRVRLHLPFRALLQADMDILRALQRSLKRSLVPVFIIPDSAGTEAFFCRSVANFEQQIEFYRNVDMEFLQEARGNSIAT
jgi:hypothetical protein